MRRPARCSTGSRTFPTWPCTRRISPLFQHRYDDAIHLLQKQADRNPKDAACRVLLARVLYQQSHDADKALAILDEAQRIAPDLISVASSHSLLLDASGRGDEALKTINAEVQRRNDFAAYLLRAEYYTTHDRLKEAEADYQHLTTFPTSKAEGYYRLGQFYDRTREFEKSHQAYAASLEADARRMDVREAQIRSLLHDPKPESRRQGLTLLEDLARKLPQDARVKLIQAQAAMLEEGVDSRQKAMQLLESAVQADPRLVEAHLELVRLAIARAICPRPRSWRRERWGPIRRIPICCFCGPGSKAISRTL